MWRVPAESGLNKIKRGFHIELSGLIKLPIPVAVKYGGSEWLFVMLTTQTGV